MAIKTFDETYYLQHNPDVLAAVRNGSITAYQHYIRNGEGEGRQPNAVFNAAGYLSANPDVLAAVKAGLISSALEHYELYGAKEGRAPGADTYNEAKYLAANADVAAAVASGAIKSGYEHYVLYGMAEGRASGGSDVPVDFTLTYNTDIATANTFAAGLVWSPGGDDRINALQDEDKLTGTGTNPTLTAELGNANDNGATIITPELNNIAEINVAFTGSGGLAVTALDLQDATGQQEINITRVSQAINTAEVGNLMTPAARLSIANTNANSAGVVEFSYATNVLKGSNTGTLDINNVQLAAVNIGENTSGIAARGVGTNGFESLTLTSSGTAANAIGTLNLPGDTGTTGVLTISGAADLTLGAKRNVFNNANNTLTEAKDIWLAGSGVAQAGGRLASIDASALTGDLTLVIDNLMDVGKADTSGVQQNVTVKGGSGDDTFVLYDAIQAGDSVSGGAGTDTLQFYNGSSIASVASSIETANMKLDGYADGPAVGLGVAVPVASSVDFDFLPDVTGMVVRNISNDAAGATAINAAGGITTFTMYDMSAAQAAAISVQHATTFNNQIENTVVEAAVKANTGSDTLGVTIAEGTNVDPRFNFTIDTVVANTGTSNTAAASTFENITLTDADTESNSVELQNFAQHTGTITLTGGLAGTFLNLDVDTAGADVYAALAGTQQGLYGLATDGSATDAATGTIWDPVGLATEVRLQAATIDASNEVSNVIVRVSTNVNDVNGAQKITMGSGNDTVIFDYLNDARAGLTISDTVKGGDGTDALVIDGNGTRVSLGASEWTNVSGFENLRLVGNGSVPLSTLIGQNSYNLALTDALISANHDASGLLNIINDNDSANDAAGGANTAGTAVESGVTVDARSLSATTHFTYNGEEGASRTTDKFIFADANVNGGNIIDGGAVDNLSTTWGSNADAFEVRNVATVTTGDLANVKNIGIIAGSNDQATNQTLTLQLNDTVIDSMVDSYHTSSTAQQEVLTVRMNSTADVSPVAKAVLDLDVAQITGRSGVNVTLDSAGARDNIKLGMGYAEIYNFDTGATAADDTITLSASQFGIAAAAVGTTIKAATAAGTNIVFGALGTGAVTDRVYVLQGSDLGYGAAANDVAIYYDADGSASGAAVLVGVLADTASLGAAAASGLTIVA